MRVALVPPPNVRLETIGPHILLANPNMEALPFGQVWCLGLGGCREL